MIKRDVLLARYSNGLPEYRTMVKRPSLAPWNAISDPALDVLHMLITLPFMKMALFVDFFVPTTLVTWNALLKDMILR